MKKIVILGCENSHADMFLGFMKDDERYRDVECIGVYSHEPDAMKALADKHGVPMMTSFDEAVGKVDGVIVTARHGDNHYKYASPYIASGVPMFIDKPITINEDEAVKLARECREAGVRLSGGSSCVHNDWVQELKADCENGVDGNTLGGMVRAPLSLSSPNGGFYFYAEHLVGIVTAIFGYYPKSVATFNNDGKITTVFRYGGYDVVGLFTDNNYSCYYAMRTSDTKVKGSEFPITGDSPCFRLEFEEFYNLLSGGDMTRSYEDFISTVFVMNAINRSIESGKECEVRKFKI